MPSRLSITINGRISPEDRWSMYEDQLETALRTWHPGLSAIGGGTLVTAEHEPLTCDVDFEIDGDGPAALRLAIVMLEAAGAPKGSHARLDDGEPVWFGVTEGMAIYLNGTDLPAEVYESDPNELVAALREALGTEGRILSQWHGPAETALYLYGRSASHMRELIRDVLTGFPLAQGCRVVNLPPDLP